MSSVDSNDTVEATEREALSPKGLSERLATVSEGDKLLFNDRDTPLEVVAVSRYSITLVDSKGAEYTISQNLQTGEWSVHRPLWWAETVDGP